MSVDTVTEWQRWLRQQREKGNMRLFDHNLNLELNASDDDDGRSKWGVGNSYYTGHQAYRRDDSGFFEVEYVQVTTDGREVGGWFQPLIRDLPEGGIAVLGRDNDSELFLVSIREEPGNPPDKNYILLGPSAQMSLSNARKDHGGNAPPRHELIKTAILFDQVQDGGRFRNKVNQIGFTVIPSIRDITLSDKERIFTRAELVEAIRAGECNSHLVEIFSHVSADLLRLQ